MLKLKSLLRNGKKEMADLFQTEQLLTCFYLSQIPLCVVCSGMEIAAIHKGEIPLKRSVLVKWWMGTSSAFSSLLYAVFVIEVSAFIAVSLVVFICTFGVTLLLTRKYRQIQSLRYLETRRKTARLTYPY